MPDQQTKVAMIVPYRFVPPTNGGHKAAFGFSEFLSKEIPFCCISTSNNKVDLAPFRLIPLFKDQISKYISPKVAIRCWRFFRREGVTHCITHQPFIALILIPVLQLLGIQLIIYVQNIEYQRFKTLNKWWWPILFVVEWVTYKIADQLFFISQDDLPPAVEIFGLKNEKCRVIPYGTALKSSPTGQEKARKQVQERHNFSPDEFLIIFFGPQSYQPNLEAVERIIQYIQPVLDQLATFPYRFLICGGGLPNSHKDLIKNAPASINYLGFVENIEEYILASDIMINPVNTGGGVKTKIIEAVALGKTVLSSRTGAIGVDQEACGPKLIQVEDEDYEAFAQQITKLHQGPDHQTPTQFYQNYYWGHAIQSALEYFK